MKAALPGMMPLFIVSLVLSGGTLTAAYPQAANRQDSKEIQGVLNVLDNIVNAPDSFPMINQRVRVDSLPFDDADSRFTGLSDADFELVASELGVEVPAIKAVVSIEAGSQMKGFWAPGVPVVNFDKTMYSRFRKRRGGKKRPASDKVPEGLRGYALREWTQLINARKIDSEAANLGTFWGMFQIGGFNYAKCGCETIDEFVELMSRSELEQLELFATFIINAGMLEDLRKKNWASFARKYNGARYAKRGYHTKMAAAYKRFCADKKK